MYMVKRTLKILKLCKYFTKTVSADDKVSVIIAFIEKLVCSTKQCTGIQDQYLLCTREVCKTYLFIINVRNNVYLHCTKTLNNTNVQITPSINVNIIM